VRALRHRRQDRVEDPVPVEEDLLVVEPEYDVPANRQSRVCGDISATVGGRPVVREPVDLHDERRADEAVDRVPIDPDLLTNDDARRSHSVDESGLESGIRKG